MVCTCIGNCNCHSRKCEASEFILGPISDRERVGLRDQRVLDGVAKLNAVGARHRYNQGVNTFLHGAR